MPPEGMIDYSWTVADAVSIYAALMHAGHWSLDSWYDSFPDDVRERLDGMTDAVQVATFAQEMRVGAVTSECSSAEAVRQVRSFRVDRRR